MEEFLKAKVYCQISVSESFGVSLLEAMACGCIPVVTDVDAMPMIVGASGVVISDNPSMEEIEKAIKSAMHMDSNAARDQAKKFTLEKRAVLITDTLKTNLLPTHLAT